MCECSGFIGFGLKILFCECVFCVSTDEGASAAQPLIRGRAYWVSHSTKLVRDKVNL